MTNLIQFQHSYSANAKMISTIDELLDVVINGLKRQINIFILNLYHKRGVENDKNNKRYVG